MADDPKRQQTIDPSVAEILENQDRKETESHLPRDARQKKIKERKKAKSRLPGRVNWDLPPDLKKQIVDIATREKIPASQVAAFLLFDGLKRLESEKIDFGPYKEVSASPRYDWNLTFPEEI